MKRYLTLLLWTTLLLDAHARSVTRTIQRSPENFFIPWFTGPLLCPSASTYYPGTGDIQPYIFVTDTFGQLGHSGGPHATPKSLGINVQNLLYFGVTNWMDIELSMQAIYTQEEGKSSTQYGDTQIIIGFPLMRSRSIKGCFLKLTIEESFPSGRYQKLNPNKLGTDIGGSGSYETTPGLTFEKIFFFLKHHPMSFRYYLAYTFRSKVSVKDFNTYGGGFGTRGKIRPGDIFTSILALEFALSQRWALALDAQYLFKWKTKFSGTQGVTDEGLPAFFNKGPHAQLSLAPAIEYGWSQNLGAIAGVWFTVYGRDTSDFISFVLSLTYTFNL